MNTAVFLNILMQSGVGDPNQFNNYLVLGYAVMWIVGFAYIISLATRQRNTQKDIQLLQRILQEDEES